MLRATPTKRSNMIRDDTDVFGFCGRVEGSWEPPFVTRQHRHSESARRPLFLRKTQDI